jgi:cell division protein FtsI (penicillin-binding protein 3)
VQNIVHEAIKQGMEVSNAIGATGIVMDLHSGEILALDNLPDFDPHTPGTGQATARFNRASLGAYEMGSTFKTFTTAMALDYGLVNLTDTTYDATHPLVYDRYIIHDAEPMGRWLTVPEIYAYSSNIGTARMAMDIGVVRQKAFLRKLGLMDPLSIELPERALPRYPDEWHAINGITISYGHGMAVTPLHLVRAFAAMADGGLLRPLTLIKGGNAGREDGVRVISDKTSREMRRLMRMVVERGTAKKADVPGYRVGGKTGTAEKVVEGGGYSHSAKLALFISAFPVDDPQYLVLVMIDEPKGTKATFNFATGGWDAAPVVHDIISRIGPMLGVKPEYDVQEDPVNQHWVELANERFAHEVAH